MTRPEAALPASTTTASFHSAGHDADAGEGTFHDEENVVVDDDPKTETMRSASVEDIPLDDDDGDGDGDYVLHDGTAESGDGDEGAGKEKKRCCNALRFGGVDEAQGYAFNTVARGGIIISNIFLSTALIRLASEAAGCEMSDETDSTPECDKEIYGFRPSSLITNIALVSGLISAFLLPVIGAIVDYTPHRKLLGVLSASFITVVQGVQIYLNLDTWFIMAILQAINGFVYFVQVVAQYAYLPDIGRHVGPKKMNWFSALFTMLQFGAQATYLILNIALSVGFGLDDVRTAMMSQAICVVWLGFTFVPGWRKMPRVPALHKRPEGKGLMRIGFAQVWKTMVGINRNYGNTLRWFFLAVAFAEAGANAFTVVSVTFMVEVIGMTGTEVGIVFLVTLLSSIPGAKLGQFVAKRTDPVTSWKVNLLVFSAVTVAGSLILTGPERKTVTYIFGVGWGILLGWFYPMENVVFTLSVPKGQESEFSGFFTYCSAILTWLPPLVFTVMNESGLHMKWGVMSLVAFLVVGCLFLQLMAPWEEVLESAKVNRMVKTFKEEEEEEGKGKVKGVDEGSGKVEEFEV